jgi:metal-responsive CopG/Arc/MetJ family transcriptional regulator
MLAGGRMKRTTVFADDEIMKKLKEIAKRENSTVSEVTRKALNEFASRRMRKRSRLSLIGIGRSGCKDVAGRAEDFLDKGFGR